MALPFDLESGPLQRTLLLRLDEEEHVLFLLWHHSISDGWSRIFLRELSVLYTLGEPGEAPDLPPLTLHYADYALWQRQQVAEFERQLSYGGSNSRAHRRCWSCPQIGPDGVRPLWGECSIPAFGGSRAGGRQ